MDANTAAQLGAALSRHMDAAERLLERAENLATSATNYLDPPMAPSIHALAALADAHLHAARMYTLAAEHAKQWPT
jgi:hypothetical protein